jgi:hypothetical protein
MGLGQRLITEFCPKPHSVSEISAFEAPNGAPNGANIKEAMVELVSLRQRFITEFCPFSGSGSAPRGQLTLTGDIRPIKAPLEVNGKSGDKNTRLFHFYDDPSPVLTVARVRIVKNDNAHIKLRLPDDLQERVSRCGKVEVHHFGAIREDHTFTFEDNYLRINTGRFYTAFYNSGEKALVKQIGDQMIIVTKVGEHPADHMQFKLIGYKSSTGNVPVVKTYRGFIVPLSFYEQARMLFPSVLEILGKPKRIKIPKRVKEREKRYVSAD